MGGEAQCDQEVVRIQTYFEDGVNYLTVDGVVGLHAQVLGCTLEQAYDHIRNIGGLDSAVMRPRNAARYEEDADIPLQAAYLAHGIAEGQYFLDANKRTALVAMVTFLEVNGYWLTAHPEEVAGWMIDLSRGLSVYDLARRVHDNSNHHEGVWGVGEDE